MRPPSGGKSGSAGKRGGVKKTGGESWAINMAANTSGRNRWTRERGHEYAGNGQPEDR